MLFFSPQFKKENGAYQIHGSKNLQAFFSKRTTPINFPPKVNSRIKGLRLFKEVKIKFLCRGVLGFNQSTPNRIKKLNNNKTFPPKGNILNFLDLSWPPSPNIPFGPFPGPPL